MNQPRIHIGWYLLEDLIIAACTWLLFYFLRTVIYDYPFSVPAGFYAGWFLYSIGWLSLHLFSGSYEYVYRKTAVTEIFRSLLTILIGCLGLLFFFILKNPQENNHNYYTEFFALLIPNLFLTITARLVMLHIIKKQLALGKVYFNTLLIGSGKQAHWFLNQFQQTRQKNGFRIRAFLNLNGPLNNWNATDIKMSSGMEQLDSLVSEFQIDEVVIAVEKQDRELITDILRHLSDKNVNIKLTPDAVDILTGAVQTSNVMGIPLIDVHSDDLPGWQRHIKRFLDVSLSAVALVLLLPFLIYVALRTWFSSPGPVFYSQERIGYRGKPFRIYKFRSMIHPAEQEQPQLSSDHDNRITSWGKIMRTWRIDELPQLWNILKGEMSLVGPRPERKYYIDQIIQQHPEYRYLYRVKPGLTSWGMVKFGYASSVDEMIQRMPYDLMYVENLSILLDIRIMLLTITIILKREGK